MFGFFPFFFLKGLQLASVWKRTNAAYRRNWNTIYVLTDFIGDFKRKGRNIILLLVSFSQQKFNFMYILIDALKIHYVYTAGSNTYPDSAGDSFHNLA